MNATQMIEQAVRSANSSSNMTEFTLHVNERIGRFYAQAEPTTKPLHVELVFVRRVLVMVKADYEGEPYNEDGDTSVVIDNIQVGGSNFGACVEMTKTLIEMAFEQIVEGSVMDWD